MLTIYNLRKLSIAAMGSPRFSSYSLPSSSLLAFPIALLPITYHTRYTTHCKHSRAPLLAFLRLELCYHP